MSQSRKRKKIKSELLDEFESMTATVPVTQLLKKVKSEPGLDENLDTSGLLNLKSNQDKIGIKIKKEPEDVVTLSSDSSSGSSSGLDSESEDENQPQVKQEPLIEINVKQELMNDGDQEIRTPISDHIKVESVNELEPDTAMKKISWKKIFFLTHSKSEAEMLEEAKYSTKLYVSERFEDDFMIQILEKMKSRLMLMNIYKDGICTSAILEKLSKARNLRIFCMRNEIKNVDKTAISSFLNIRSSTLETFKMKIEYDPNLIICKWPKIKTLKFNDLRFSFGRITIYDIPMFDILERFSSAKICHVNLSNDQHRESWFTYLKRCSTTEPDFSFKIRCYNEEILHSDNISEDKLYINLKELFPNLKNMETMNEIKSLIFDCPQKLNYMLALSDKLPQLESITFDRHSTLHPLFLKHLEKFNLKMIKITMKKLSNKLVAISNLLHSQRDHLLEFKMDMRKVDYESISELVIPIFKNMIDFNIPGIRYANNELNIYYKDVIDILDKFPNMKVCNIALKEDNDDISWISYYKKFSKDHPDVRILFNLKYEDKTTMKIEFTDNEYNKYLPM